MKSPLVLLVLLVSSFVTLTSEAQDKKKAADVLSGKADAAAFATFAEPAGIVWKELKEGANCFGKSDRYQWQSIPPELSNVRFTLHPVHAGKLSAKVKSGGLVFIATSTRWKGGGNSSGNWMEEAMDEKDLRRAGWRPLGQFKKLSNNDTGEWLIFYRKAAAGEVISVRTEKYAAPILLTRYSTSLASSD